MVNMILFLEFDSSLFVNDSLPYTSVCFVCMYPQLLSVRQIKEQIRKQEDKYFKSLNSTSMPIP